MDDSIENMIEKNSSADALNRLEDERIRNYRGSRHGEGDVPIRKSPSRIMAELREKLEDCIEMDFSEILNKNEDYPRNLLVDIPLLIAQLTRERKRRRDLEKTLADGLKFCFKLEKSKHHLRKRLINLKIENTRLQAELHKTQVKNKALESDMKDKKEKYDLLRIEMIEKKHENIESQMRIFEMEKEIDILKSQLSSASQELKDTSNRIEELQSNVTKLERELHIEDSKCEEYNKSSYQFNEEDELREIQELEESVFSFKL